MKLFHRQAIHSEAGWDLPIRNWMSTLDYRVAFYDPTSIRWTLATAARNLYFLA